MNLRRIIATLPLITLLSGLPLATQADAATAGFSVSPPVITLTADPGKSVTGTVKVTNLSDNALSLGVDKSYFAAKGEEGEVDLQTIDNNYSLAPWFNISAAAFSIAPKTTKEVKFSVDVPSSAEPGGRYGSLIFHTNPSALAPGQSGAAIKQQLATLIFLRINGAANEKLRIESFAADNQYYEYGPINFTTRIRNQGNVHEKPSGTIVIKNMIGLKVATLPLEEKYVIPNSVRKLSNTWKSHWGIGKYTAQATVNGPNSAKLSATTSFIIFPYKVVLAILLILAFLYFFFARSRKRLKRTLRVLFGRE